jgi:hypothetical protein
MSVKEILTVDDFLASLRVADTEIQSYKNLTIAPLISDKIREMMLKTLEEAADEIDITEIDGGGSVPKLKFTNRGDSAVLILQGSIIKGNLQDRAIRHTFLVHAHSEVEGDVFCIESSRWHSTRGQRKALKPAHHLSSDIRREFSRNSQGSVWDKIEQKRQRMQVKSNTDSADFIYEAYRKELEDYKKAFTMNPEYSGIVGVVEGKPVAMDISGIKGVFHRQFPDLISSLAIDALDQEYCKEIRGQKRLTVAQFLSAVARSIKKEKNAVGGKGIELEGEGVVGGALVDHDVVVQMEAFVSA